MENRRLLVENFLNKKDVERVPVSFWYHFVSFHNHHTGLEDPEVLKTVLEAQKAYYTEVQPDLLKIMSDGFFAHPSLTTKRVETVADLKAIRAVGAAHPWITKQVEYVKAVCDHAGDAVYKYYNIFSPLQYIRLRFEEYDEDFTKFVRLFNEDPDAMVQAAQEILKDVLILVDAIFKETSVDGIYYSVQCVQDASFDKARHALYVRPLDLAVMDRILRHTDNIMLHICGYGNYTNALEWYADYPAKIINWATHSENIDMAEGQKIFADKVILGGFDNSAGAILYTGTDAELEAYIDGILDGTGTRGVALGADCTISANIPTERLHKIKDIAAGYSARRRMRK